MDLKLKNKRALVTGGSHGIGLAIAFALADEGCHVAICARGEEGLVQAVSQLKAKGVEAMGMPADVLNPNDIEKVGKAIMEAWGGIDIVVNNVGGGGNWGEETIEETSETVWLDVFNKNVLAAVRFTKWALPSMRRQKWGRIVTISSISGLQAGGRSWYLIAKSMENNLMKSLAVHPQYARDGITFNTVAPGSIMIPDTKWAREREENPATFMEKEMQLPLGRLGTPEEVAALVAFICSPKANYLNGACVAVDGGESRVL